MVEPADKDVDHQTLIRVGARMGTVLQRVCRSAIMGVAEQPLWQIDGGLRPEGKGRRAGRAMLSSHKELLRAVGRGWEFKALLKGRPVAGDPDLSQAYMDLTRPVLWSASKLKNFVYDCQKMRKRVEDLIPAPLKDREIKARPRRPARCGIHRADAPARTQPHRRIVCAPATRSTRCSACPKAAMSLLANGP